MSVDISDLNKDELLYKLHIKSIEKNSSQRKLDHESNYFGIMYKDSGKNFKITVCDAVFYKGILETCVAELREHTTAKTTAHETKVASENESQLQKLKKEIEDALAYYYAKIIGFCLIKHPDTWDRETQEIYGRGKVDIIDLEKMRTALRLLLAGNPIDNALHQELVLMNDIFKQKRIKSQIEKFIEPLLQLLPKPKVHQQQSSSPTVDAAVPARAAMTPAFSMNTSQTGAGISRSIETKVDVEKEKLHQAIKDLRLRLTYPLQESEENLQAELNNEKAKLLGSEADIHRARVTKFKLLITFLDKVVADNPTSKDEYACFETYKDDIKKQSPKSYTASLAQKIYEVVSKNKTKPGLT